jgi:hypothetical protein
MGRRVVWAICDACGAEVYELDHVCESQTVATTEVFTAIGGRRYVHGIDGWQETDDK